MLRIARRNACSTRRLKEHVDFVVLAGDLVDPALAGPRGCRFSVRAVSPAGRGGVQGLLGLRAARSLGASGPMHGMRPHGVFAVCRRTVERLVHAAAMSRTRRSWAPARSSASEFACRDFQADTRRVVYRGCCARRGRCRNACRGSDRILGVGGRAPAARSSAGQTSGPLLRFAAGRDVRRSPGPHGCTLVHVDEARRVRTSFIPTDAVRYLDRARRVSEPTTAEQLYSGDQRACQRAVERSVRARLAGRMDCRREARPRAGSCAEGNWPPTWSARLRAELARRPSVWTLAVEPDSAGGDVAPARYDEDTLLGEFLRTVRHYEENSDAPLDLEPYLSQRHVAGSLGAAVALDDPAERRRVLAEVARLGVELLSPEEPRP